MSHIVSCVALSLLLGVTAALSGCASTLDPVHDALKARYDESLSRLIIRGLRAASSARARS